MQQIKNVYSAFSDTAGRLLDAGSVFIGAPNLDPETNPVDVFWDEAGTIPAAQPLKTIAGYIARNGTPARVYTPDSYSIRVRQLNGAEVYFVAAVAVDTIDTGGGGDIRLKPSGGDDRAQVQAAIDALPDSGGIIRLDGGTFALSGPWQVSKDAVTFDGRGEGLTIVRMMDNTNDNAIEFVGVRADRLQGGGVRNLTIDGNRAANINGTDGSTLKPLQTVDRYWTGIRAKFSDNLVVENVEVHDCAANGIQAEDSSCGRYVNVHTHHNGFNGFFFVNDSQDNTVLNCIIHNNYDIGVSSEVIDYQTPGEDRAAPPNGRFCDGTTMIGNKVFDNGGNLGWSPRNADADYGLGGIAANRMTIIGNTILRQGGLHGTGIRSDPVTYGHVVIGNVVLDSSFCDMYVISPRSNVHSNTFGTALDAAPVQQTVSIANHSFDKQNTNVNGYTSDQYKNSAGVIGLRIGYGNANADTAIYRNKAFIDAPGDLLLGSGGTLAATLKTNLVQVSDGALLTIGAIANPKSKLAIKNIPVYVNKAAAQAAGFGTGDVYASIDNSTGEAFLKII